MGHTDVVPVNPDGWSRDPFGGEIVDGDVWGRGAVDMLNLTATMAVAFRRLAESGFTPKGTLDLPRGRRRGGARHWGAEWLVEHERDAVYADYVLTESGGFQIPTAEGPRLPVMVGEKGTFWSKLTVRGTPGHGSQPFRTDNALVTAAEVVRRIAEYRPRDPHPRDVAALRRGHATTRRSSARRCSTPSICASSAPTLPLGLGRQVYSCTHTTFAPTVAHGGTKTNVIPDLVELEVDIRTLPGQTG